MDAEVEEEEDEEEEEEVSLLVEEPVEGEEDVVDSVVTVEVVVEDEVVLVDEVDLLDEVDVAELVVEREELVPKERVLPRSSSSLTGIPVSSLPRVRSTFSSLATSFPVNPSTERSVSLSNNPPPSPTPPQRRSSTVYGILSVPSWLLVSLEVSTTFTSVLERRFSTSELLPELQFPTLLM